MELGENYGYLSHWSFTNWFLYATIPRFNRYGAFCGLIQRGKGADSVLYTRSYYRGRSGTKSPRISNKVALNIPNIDVYCKWDYNEEIEQGISRLDKVRKRSDWMEGLLDEKEVSYRKRKSAVQILTYIVFHPGCYRKDIASNLKITKMNVSQFVGHLKAKGYVIEKETVNSTGAKVGPKPTKLYVAEKKILTVGVYLDVNYFSIYLVDLSDQIIYEKQVMISEVTSNSQLVEQIRMEVGRIYLEYGEIANNIIGIGVTTPLEVDPEKGRIYISNNPLERNFINIKSTLEKRFAIPVYVGKDIFGAMCGNIFSTLYSKDISYAYIDISREIKAAYVSSYNAHTGITGNIMELGHMSINFDGPLCTCGGRGCYQQYGGVDWLYRSSDCNTIKEVKAKLDSKDPKMIRLMDEYIHVTALALNNLSTMVHMSSIIIGGEFSDIGNGVIRLIEDLLNKKPVGVRKIPVKLASSKLRADVLKYGSAYLPYYYLLSEVGNK